MEQLSAPADVAVEPDVIRVSAARQRYLGGVMSFRWWYKQIESGHLPHFRAGVTVLLRRADVEAFVAEMFREQDRPVPPGPTAPPPPTRRASRRADGGLRFFPDTS